MKKLVSSVRVGPRLMISFAIVLLLTVVVGGIGTVGTHRQASAVGHLLRVNGTDGGSHQGRHRGLS